MTRSNLKALNYNVIMKLTLLIGLFLNLLVLFSVALASDTNLKCNLDDDWTFFSCDITSKVYNGELSCNFEEAVISCSNNGTYRGEELLKKTAQLVKVIRYKFNFSIKPIQLVETIIHSHIKVSLENIEASIIWFDGHEFPGKFSLTPSVTKKGDICSLIMVDASLNIKQIDIPKWGNYIPNLIKIHLNKDLKKQLKKFLQDEVTYFGKSDHCEIIKILAELLQKMLSD